jgi:hypothetical protein
MAPPNEKDMKQLQKKWANSSAKATLQRLVKHGLDKEDDGTRKRADVIYKMSDTFDEFPSKFFTKQLQALRKPKKDTAINFEEIVDIEDLEKEWEGSQAKIVLEHLVANGLDIKQDGNKQRADLIYKMEGCFEHLKHFPREFVTQKVQKLRKGRQTQAKSPREQELQSNWDNSRAKVVLERLVQHGFDCNEDGKCIRADEVHKLRVEFANFPQVFFTQQLKLMRKAKPKPPVWKNSRARVILQQLIVVGLDRDLEGNELPVLTIYNMDDQFSRFPLKRFLINLEDLREQTHEVLDKSLRDSVAVDDYLEKNPPSNMDAPRYNGIRYPKWQGSDAQKLLRQDLKLLLHNGSLFKGKDGVLPQKIQMSKPEYQQFPLTVFRNHIYKEIIHDKQVNWNKNKKSQIAKNSK